MYDSNMNKPRDSDRLPERGDSRRALLQNLRSHGYTPQDIAILDSEALAVARAAHAGSVEPLIDADTERRAARQMGRDVLSTWNPNRPLSIRESAALANLASAHLGELEKGRTSLHEYTVNLKPILNAEEQFARRMAFIEALGEAGIEVTGEGCGFQEGKPLGCNVGIRSDRVDVEPSVRRLARAARIELDSVVLVGEAEEHVEPDHRGCYGSDHKMGVVVPKGGSMCRNCAFGVTKKDGPHCLNTCWSSEPTERGGGGGQTRLPVQDPTTYCCDMWKGRA